MSLFTSLLRDRASIGWPNTCAICAAASRGRAGRTCDACIERWAPLKPRCRLCAVGVPAAAERCGACIKDAPALAGTIAAADYGYPWDGVLQAFKFHDALDLAPALAALMHRAWRVADTGPIDALLAVPLSTARLRERGYNQAAVLARRLSRMIDRPVLDAALLRAVDTPAQATQARAERLRALRGAFVVEPAAVDTLRGRHVTVIDDVMTTGATLHEVATTLQRAGVASVRAWVAARTPP